MIFSIFPAGSDRFIRTKVCLEGLLIATLLVSSTPKGHAQQNSDGTTPVLYSQGDPSDNAQYLLQKLNRARMDPVGEGQRLKAWLTGTTDGQSVVTQYGTDPDQVASDLASLPAVPPLAFNADLLASSLAHSADLAAHNGIGPGGTTLADNNKLGPDGVTPIVHLGYDGSTPDSRVYASGFRAADGSDGFVGECVASGFDSLDTIHAGFLVDWGNPSFGHRRIEMSAGGVNMVGMGVTAGPDNTLIDTGDYGWPGVVVGGKTVVNADVPALLTGVVYRDANSNGQYDPGEGVAGVTVSVGGYYYAVTTASGGYSLPLVNADGSNVDGPVLVTVTFADGSVRTNTVAVTSSASLYGSYRANVEWEVVTAAPPATDPAKPSISGGGTVAKGGKLKLVVARPVNSDLSEPMTLAYTLKGTAAANVDYMPLPGTVTIPAGKATAKIKVTALDATVLDRPPGAITLQIKLKGVSGAQGKTKVTFTP